MSKTPVDAFYKELTALALSSSPPPAEIDQARHQFTDLVVKGHQRDFITKLFEVDPQCATQVNMFITDFLDNVAQPTAYWTNAIAIPFSVANNGKPAKFKLTAAQANAIVKLFDVPCRAYPQLFHPWNIDAVHWDKWIEFNQSVFSASPSSLELSNDIDNPQDVASTVVLMLHFHTTSNNQKFLLEAVNQNIEKIINILQSTFKGREHTPMHSALPAHRAYTICEIIAFQIELERWSLRLNQGKFIVRQEIKGEDSYLSLWDASQNTPQGFIPLDDTFPWIINARWRVLCEWLFEHENVELQQSPEFAKRMREMYDLEINRVVKHAYEMIPEIPQTTPIGFTIISENGPAFDRDRVLPLLLTERQASELALQLKFTNGDEYQVAAVSFTALYVLSLQNISFRVDRDAYHRIRKESATCSLPGFPVNLPPSNESFTLISPNQIIPPHLAAAFDATYGRSLREKAIEWLEKKRRHQ